LYDNPQLDDHCEIELKDGRTLERHSTVLRDASGRHLGRVWFFRDISMQKNHEAALIQLARHDPLTGAANRRYFFERCEQEFMRSSRYKTPLSVALIDLDHFKRINDDYGHSTGDEVLRVLSQRIRELLRESDLLARIGGEEFAILMPSTGLAGAALMAERLRMTVAEQASVIAGHTLYLRFSAGVTQLKGKDQSIEDCLRRADEAMYRAKQAGRDRVEACA
ncbi:MAG: GGDEF domain-containing protein, partial [Curvibacter sp.]